MFLYHLPIFRSVWGRSAVRKTPKTKILAGLPNAAKWLWMLIVAFTFASLQGEDPANLQVPQGVGPEIPRKFTYQLVPGA